MEIERPTIDSFLMRHATAITIGTVTLLMLLAALSFWRQEEVSIVARGWLVHTHKVIGHLELLQSKLEDAETGQRGYLLTGNAEYLEPYEDALREVPIRTRRMRCGNRARQHPVKTPQGTTLLRGRGYHDADHG